MTVRRAPATKARRTVDEFNQHDDVVDLRTYAVILWRRRWVVVITTILVTAIAVGLTFTQTPMYDAQAELAIEPLRRSEDTSLTDLILGSATIETERRVMTSRPVTEAVIETLQLDLEPKDLDEQVTVNSVRDTRVVTVKVTDESPDRAAAIANAYVAKYLELRRNEALDRLSDARDTLGTRANALQDELGDINRELSREDDPAEVSALQAQRDSILTQLAQVTAQQLTADAESDLVRGGGTVLRDAEAPDFPSSPKKARTGVLAIVLGGMLGVGLAFGREFLDDGINSEDVLVRATGGAPVFGRIPTWEEEHHRAVALVSPNDHAVEAYRELRANVRFVIGNAAKDTAWEGRRRARTATSERRLGKSVLITSSIAGEGKSSTAANLAVVAAQGGAKIVIVDADLRRPQIANIFGIGASSGLSDHLAEGGDISRRLISGGLPNLHVLPSGPTPPNPAELLSSRAMLDLMVELEQTHDLVIIDSPPLLAVADALELAQLTSATLLVASAATSSQRATRRAIERLSHIGVLISGAVLNKVDRDGPNSYYAYYQPYANATAAAATTTSTAGITPRGTKPTVPLRPRLDAEDHDEQPAPEPARTTAPSPTVAPSPRTVPAALPTSPTEHTRPTTAVAAPSPSATPAPAPDPAPQPPPAPTVWPHSTLPAPEATQPRLVSSPTVDVTGRLAEQAIPATDRDTQPPGNREDTSLWQDDPSRPAN